MILRGIVDLIVNVHANPTADMPHVWNGNPYFVSKMMYESVSIRITNQIFQLTGLSY